MLMGFPSTAKLIAVLHAASLFLFQGFQIPAPMGLVNDFADIIQPAAAERMERIAEDVRAKSRGEIAVVTLPDIGTRDVQEVARDIGRQWKVGGIGDPGDPTRNAGVVILAGAQRDEQRRARAVLYRDSVWQRRIHHRCSLRHHLPGSDAGVHRKGL